MAEPQESVADGRQLILLTGQERGDGMRGFARDGGRRHVGGVRVAGNPGEARRRSGSVIVPGVGADLLQVCSTVLAGDEVVHRAGVSLDGSAGEDVAQPAAVKQAAITIATHLLLD
jgi:hypothetical protein